jgi:hypothetical protein
MSAVGRSIFCYAKVCGTNVAVVTRNRLENTLVINAKRRIANIREYASSVTTGTAIRRSIEKASSINGTASVSSAWVSIIAILGNRNTALLIDTSIWGTKVDERTTNGNEIT